MSYQPALQPVQVRASLLMDIAINNLNSSQVSITEHLQQFLYCAMAPSHPQAQQLGSSVTIISPFIYLIKLQGTDQWANESISFGCY